MTVKVKKAQSKKNKTESCLYASARITKKQRTTSTDAMRVAIAKDVISQLNSKKLIPERLTWVEDSKMGSIEDFIESKVNKIDQDKLDDFGIDLREYVCNIKKCEVCALGAIFISAVSLYNDMTIYPGYYRSTRNKNPYNWKPDSAKCYNWKIFEDLNTSPLIKYFTKSQMELIESAYEGYEGTHEVSTSKEKVICKAFYFKYPSNKNRMIAIMENIIDNNGTFNPKKSISIEDVIDYTSLSLHHN